MDSHQDLGKRINELLTEIPQWTEQTEKSIIELRQIANSIDNYHREATGANIAGSVTGAVGGILSIAGLAASPFTFGGSLLLTGVGMATSAAGGATNIVATLSDNSYKSKKQKRVDKIIQQYLKQQEGMVEKLEQLNEAIESCIKIETKKAVNVLIVGTVLRPTTSLSQILTVTSAVTKRALKILKRVSGVFASLTLAWDIYSVWKDVKKLKTKETEISQMIREVAKCMEEERGNFEKITSQLKHCTALQKFL